MAIIQGIHILAHGDKMEARRIAVDIQQNQRLLVGSASWFGTGAYAWYIGHIPSRFHDAPQVLFDIDDQRVVSAHTPHGVSLGFFLIPGEIGGYVTTRVLRFLNL
jgi:hypothetical protein